MLVDQDNPCSGPRIEFLPVKGTENTEACWSSYNRSSWPPTGKGSPPLYFPDLLTFLQRPQWPQRVKSLAGWLGTSLAQSHPNSGDSPGAVGRTPSWECGELAFLYPCQKAISVSADARNPHHLSLPMGEELALLNPVYKLVITVIPAKSRSAFSRFRLKLAKTLLI